MRHDKDISYRSLEDLAFDKAMIDAIRAMMNLKPLYGKDNLRGLSSYERSFGDLELAASNSDGMNSARKLSA